MGSRDAAKWGGRDAAKWGGSGAIIFCFSRNFPLQTPNWGRRNDFSFRKFELGLRPVESEMPARGAPTPAAVRRKRATFRSSKNLALHSELTKTTQRLSNQAVV